MIQTTIDIPQELFAPAESSSFEGTYDLDVLKAGPDLYDFAQPLSWQVTITNTGEALLVSGTVEGTAKTSCVRCLETFEVPLMGEVEGYFLLKEDDEAPSEMEEDEFDVLGPENQIDLIPLLDAALLMDVPLLPLCEDDCKGLCPVCGINLNNETCDCQEKKQEQEEADAAAAHPFAALADLKFDGDEE